MNIAMIGTGYVGLVTGTLFADRGNNVTCVDLNPNIVSMLKNGESPIYEPGLEELIQKNHSKSLHFTGDISDIRDADIVFLAVGTPSSQSGEFNLTYLNKAAQDVSEVMKGKDDVVIVTKSTVPQGSWKKLSTTIDQNLDNWHYVSNPETLAEGNAVRDFSRPDRVIIGTDSDFAFDKMKTLYAPFVQNAHPILHMGPADAELSKLGANTLLAQRVAFNNELAQICDATEGADYDKVRQGIISDRRIGQFFSYASLGYGGSCFPKDVQGLVWQARQDGVSPDVLARIHQSNEGHKQYAAERIMKLVGKDRPHVAMWGLTFKPDTDDMRDSATIPIINYLIEQGATVSGYDPQDKKAKDVLHPDTNIVDNPYTATEGADVLVLATEWPEFDVPDFARLRETMVGRLLYDGRNRWDPNQANEAGFSYRGMGRNYPLSEN